MILFWLGCTQGEKDSAIEMSWIETTQWRQGSLETDLFPEHQPEEINCPVTGFQVEIDQLEIQTDN